MKILETELARIVKPFDVDVIWRALDGGETIFDVDAAWSSHHHGSPRTVPRGVEAFDGAALVAGAQAIAFLAAYLPAGDPRRRAIPNLDARIRKRLANPDLLLFADINGPRHGVKGEPYDLPGADSYHKSHGVDNGALVMSGGYLYFRPAKLERGLDRAILEDTRTIVWPNTTYGFAGVYSAYRAFHQAGFRRLVERAVATPVAADGFETDPTQSCPDLVGEVSRTLSLGDDASALYLQILALCDVSDKWVRAWSGWTPARHKKAVAELETNDLIEVEKKPRAGRTATLPGTWEKLRSPQPAIERWKLSLYDAAIVKGALSAPLGRILPLKPIDELFAAAWKEVASNRSPEAARKRGEDAKDWLAAIKAAPADDTPRRVYADHLTDIGDPRGELITLQLRRHELAREGADLAEVCAAEERLLADYGTGWIEPVYSIVEDVRWDRGFIVSITVHGAKFAKHADKLFEALPLLREIRLLSARRNHIQAFVGCPAFERIRQLDFTPDEYIRDDVDLAALLDGDHLPRLEYLRIGFHRPGEGFGAQGAKAIASCGRLGDLRFLEIAGQFLRPTGADALVSAGFNKLEVLRLPLNAITDACAKKLLKRLEAGSLPALRVLDLGNVVDTGFVTKAVNYHRNRVSPETQHAIVRHLGERAGYTDRYAGDPVAVKAKQKVIAQGAGFPFASKAKSDRSRCIVCNKTIGKGSIRIGVERENEDIGRYTGWLHPECRNECAELAALENVDERLAANSRGLWPPK